MIDSHAHINLRPLNTEVPELIERAALKGISAIINIGIDIPTSHESISLAENFPQVWAACGIHPNTDISDKDIEHTLNSLEHMALHPKAIAIGEIGLDFYRDRVAPQRQEKLFRMQLEIARKLSMPVVVHLRDSYDAFKYLWSDYREIEGVCHAYSGDEDFTDWLLEETKLYVGLGGPITFKNYRNSESIQKIPLERILTETDCPYLTPHPYRGKTNEPSFIPFIVDKLAEIKGVSSEQIDKITSRNVSRLFGIGLPMRGESRVFIHDMNTMDRIASQEALSDTAVEIGAGPGTLTERLAHKYNKLYAVEPDISEYQNIDDVTLIQKSILDVDLSRLSAYSAAKLDIWGNIPYHITSPILDYIDKNIPFVSQAFLLIQLEVAERLVAKPGTKDYGIPTVLLGNRWHIRRLMKVGRGLFRPQPDVDSALIHMVPRKEPIVAHTDLFQAIVKKSFGQRRKMLRKSLKEYLPNSLRTHYLTKRPEELSIDDFGTLVKILEK